MGRRPFIDTLSSLRPARPNLDSPAPLCYAKGTMGVN